MFRFLYTKTFFNTDSTAIKILYAIKDLQVIKMENKFNSDHINNQKFLLKKLSEAIALTIHYEIYQKLPNEDKRDIRKNIAQTLYKEAIKYDSTYTVEIEDDNPWTRINEFETRTQKGITFSKELSDNYPYDEAVAVNFPEKLFDMPVLQRCIRAAIINNYNSLLKQENEEERNDFNL